METLYLYLPLLIIALHILTNRILHKLQNLPPTPFPSLPFIGHLYLIKKPIYKSLSNLAKQYGPVISLNLGCVPAVVVSSPSAVEECLVKNDIIFANRPKTLNAKYAGYNYTSLIWTSYGEHWRNIRRISSLELLSSNRIQLLSDIRVDEVRSLIRKLSRTASSTQSSAHDMKSSCFDVSFNVITRMIAGKRYYGGDMNAEESGEAKAFHEIISQAAKLNPKVMVLDFLPFMRWFGLNGVEKEMKNIQERRDKFMQSLIDEIRSNFTESSGKKKTMMGTLLTLQQQEPDYYSDETIKSLMLALLQAGSDTTATTMEWGMAHLIDNPDVLKKAQSEIDSIVAGQERLILESDLASLPHIRCIINETLRLHPPAPLLLPHEASQDCMVGGFKIRDGTLLFVNIWDIQRNPKYWDDPEKFIPERFEGSEIIGGGGKEGLKFLPFGLGRRGCPGNNLAIHILGFALGSLIQCFNWEMEDGKAMDLTEGLGIPISKAQPLVAKCLPRPNMQKLLSSL
ncbi:OLC1v1016925C1 [Oldenlandia corymbosa var. corymbosa]|uniref:OLC1v1016925C1 n=1 Tax=Oldenlandia corymbosa var. corymbosa TaxID=529605 RepID=A0AAV1E896_OLDCO|nr:OLC1v1016925C1 [Oldenlandia corymbosa var. corymbosa]